MTTAVTAAQPVASRVGPITSPGALAPAAARSPMTVAGSSCSEAVLRAQNRAWASLAVPGCGLSSSRRRIASSPNGVAALPRPSTFAATFITMAPMAGCSGGTSGKSRRRIGRAARESSATRPASSARRISPSQSASTPTSPMERVTADWAELVMAAVRAPILPFSAAATTEIPSRRTQMKLMREFWAAGCGKANFW